MKDKEVKGKELGKNNKNLVKSSSAPYIDDNLSKNKHKKLLVNKAEVTQPKVPHLSVSKLTERSRNKISSPPASLSEKKSQYEAQKLYLTQLLIQQNKDIQKINVIRTRIYNKINQAKNDKKASSSKPKSKPHELITQTKLNKTATSKQSTTSSSALLDVNIKPVNKKQSVIPKKKKIQETSFMKDHSYSKIPKMKIFNSNNVSMCRLSSSGHNNTRNSVVKKNMTCYSKKSIALNSSMDYHTNRNVSSNIHSVNETLIGACASFIGKTNDNHDTQTQSALNAEGVEDVHLRLVQIYQQKKSLLVSLVDGFGENNFERFDDNLLEDDNECNSGE